MSKAAERALARAKKACRTSDPRDTGVSGLFQAIMNNKDIRKLNPKPLTRQAIQQWKQCPPDRVRQVEAASGVPAHELRPDFWSPPKEGKGAA